MKTSITFSIHFFIISIFLSCCKQAEHKERSAAIERYTCPMHPQIIEDKPSSCPICGMNLVRMTSLPDVEGSIMLTETQVKLANITTTLAHVESMKENKMLTGKLKINEDETEVISSRVQGRIEKLYFKEIGEKVIKGEALYEIYSEPLFVLQQEYLLALRQFKELKVQRYESFLKASEKKLILFGMTQEQVTQLAHRNKTDSRIIFLAPVTGVIAKIDVVDGQYVSEGSALFQIEKLDTIWVEADLYTGESSLIKTGERVNVLINGFENMMEGRVSFISPEYNQGSQAITLRAVIKNHKGEFKPGMQANIILSHSNKEIITLPVDAVIKDVNQSYVWILEKKDNFRLRLVTTGLENSEKAEITQGLKEGEEVVISGAYLLYGELVLKKGEGPMAVTHQH